MPDTTNTTPGIGSGGQEHAFADNTPLEGGEATTGGVASTSTPGLVGTDTTAEPPT